MSLGTAELVKMLRQMILIREFDDLAIKLRTEGRIYGAVHPYIGEEAVAVGTCAALKTTDRVTSTHRGHGHCIAKGAATDRMMAELFGRVDGYCKGRGGSMHIADFAVGMLGANGIVGAGMPLGCGAAWAAQLEGKGGVAATFFGDGATGEGEFHESLNLASVWKLPLLFVCENNHYGAGNFIDTTRVVPDVSAHAAAYGMPGISVDGNDVMAVYEAAEAAVERARKGAGPTLIECKTYRWLFHAMRHVPPPDTRPAEQVADWKGRDPIARFEAQLLAEGAVTTDQITELRADVQRELEAAVAFAEASPFPQAKDLLVDMFAP
jgi:TPP-dependent pyruvate/acetoin dehydrogenase alpha subunit